MKVSDYLREQLVLLDVDAFDKKSAIAKTVENMAMLNVLTNPARFLEEVMEREALGSTAIGGGVALPHARTQSVSEIVIAITRLKKGVIFSPDQEPVRLLILIGTPIKSVGEYLKVLARLSKFLRDDSIRNALLSAQTGSQVIGIFANAAENSIS